MKAPQTLIRPWTMAAILALLGCLTPVVAGEDDSPLWQPMLAESFDGDAKDIGAIKVAVYRRPGCVFLLLEDKGVYCSPAGGGRFRPVAETWEQVYDHAQELRDSKHVFAVADTCIKESLDGGESWLTPIPFPKDFVPREASVEYDATNDIVYVMNPGGDLYRLTRRK